MKKDPMKEDPVDVRVAAARVANLDPTVLEWEMPGDQDWDADLWERIGVGPDWDRLTADIAAAGGAYEDSEGIAITCDPAAVPAVLRVVDAAQAGQYGDDVRAYWSAAVPT